jgi:uncharacterized protein (UPF0262 family)
MLNNRSFQGPMEGAMSSIKNRGGIDRGKRGQDNNEQQSLLQQLLGSAGVDFLNNILGPIGKMFSGL